jgi:hypothetical protein
MISYVSRILRMPSWWIPDWWRKAFPPMIALFGCMLIPVRSDTRRLVRWSSFVSTRVVSPNRSFRVLSAITTSSSAALPARSPMPLTQHSTWRAPTRTAASELATAIPRSLWQCTEITALSILGTFSRMLRMNSPNSSGME